MGLCELLHHAQSYGIPELEGAQPRRPVTIDFGNERHRERGNVFCPWGWLEERDEQKQKLYEERGVKCCVTTQPQRKKKR